MVLPKGIQSFAEEAQLSTEQIQQIMYPPRVKRNIKTQKEVPTSAIFKQKPINQSPNRDFSPRNIKAKFMPFKMMKSTPQNKKVSALQDKIQNFFRHVKQCSLNYKSQILEPELRNFILFQPILKCPSKAKICLTFYHLVKKMGYFIDVLAGNKLKQVIKQFEQVLGIDQKYPEQLYLELYKKHILAYELYKNHRIQNKQPVNIDIVKYYTSSEVDSILEDGIESIQFNRDIFVIQGFADYVGFDNNLLSIEYFKKNYGDKLIDARVQRFDAYGFDVYASSMYNVEEQLTASEYLTYQELEGTPQVKKCPIHKKLKRNQVCFAVNVDLIGKEEIQRQIHNKLGKVKFVQYVNQLDALSYCENWIPGCNMPQFYFKVKGVWTGGHQQNVAMASVNVNLGPDNSEWYTLDIEHVPRLRKQVIQQFGVDIIEHEGLWFAPPEWLMINNYPIKKLIQKKGDLVYSGPGTLHWVRSLGKCFQIAWNVFPKTEKQWRQATTRMRINQQIKFNHVFMPLKSLALKILNHQYKKRNRFTQAVYCSLVNWLKEQNEQITTFISNIGPLNPKFRELQDLDSLCQICRHQVLTIYSLSDQDKTLCLKCFSQQPPKSRKSVYLKIDQESIKSLLMKVKKLNQCDRDQDYEQVQALCSKKYCGVVQCAYNICAKQLPYQSIDPIQKVNNQENPNLISSHQNSNLKSASKTQQIQIDSNLHIDPEELLRLFALNMPKCSWASTEDVLKAQANIMQEIGYLPRKKLKLSQQCFVSSAPGGSLLG